MKRVGRNFPDFSFEEKLWADGYKAIAGVDEVGRGAFAGPVIAGAVVFDPLNENLKLKTSGACPSGIKNSELIINDSKKLKASERSILADWIKINSVAWGVGEASIGLINRLGIVKATRIAMRRAIGEVNGKLKIKNEKLEFLLIDAFYIPYIRGLQKKFQLPIVKGDERSLTIASASIIAKVHRDHLMNKLSLKYSNYYWETNKGYGTEKHQKAIQSYGLTPLHRKKFVESWQSKIMTKSEKLKTAIQDLEL